MKKLVLLVAVLLQTTLTFAQNYRNTAELFIEIADRGNFVVTVDDDFAGSSKGRFRFYEVSTAPTVIITRDNVEIFRKQVRLQPNTRFIATFSKRSGWRLVTTLPIFDRNQYILDSWDGRLQVAGPIYDDTIDDQEFAELLGMVNKEPFESNKINLIKTSLKGSMITTDQLITLIKVFNFDDKKMVIAKYGYDFVVDKRRFIKIAEVLTFQSSKDELLNFINKKTP